MCSRAPDTSILSIDDPSELDHLHYIAVCLHQSLDKVSTAYSQLHDNVRRVFCRQWVPSKIADRPAIELRAEVDLLQALALLTDIHMALTTLARAYDAAYVAVCKHRNVAIQGRVYDVGSAERPIVDLKLLAEELAASTAKAADRVIITATEAVFMARWEPVAQPDFSLLPILEGIEGVLPGEQPVPADAQTRKTYAGIAGGGGSDIISASALGHLLRGVGKEMDLLISTRMWLTGSQGKPGSRVGAKREVFNHGGPAIDTDGKPVLGTFRVTSETYTPGRDLETIPLPHFRSIFLALDPGVTAADMPPAASSSNSPACSSPPAPLREQYLAIIANHPPPIPTLLSIDTGGDVFDPSPASQDFRVQTTLASLPIDPYPSLTTAILCPGVDAPTSAPSTALQAGAMRYRLTPAERRQLLDLLVDKYRMDGRDETRFGKTNLCLQKTLRGQVGWQVLDLPAHVVETGSNPWGVFEWVSPGMADVVFVGTRRLAEVLGEMAEESGEGENTIG